MRSGGPYRIGMTIVIVASLISVGMTLFPTGTRRAIDDIGDVLARAADGARPIDLRVETDEVVVGRRVRWSIVVVNGGPGDETGPVVVRGTLPPDAEYVSSSGRDWSCTHTEVGNVVTCSLASPLSASATTELVILVDSAAAGDRRYTATVIGTGDDPDLANNATDGQWRPPSGAVADDAESVRRGTAAGTAAAGATATTAGPTRASGSVTAPASGGDGTDGAGTGVGAGADTLPVTGPGSTVVLLSLGLALCLVGCRLVATAALPSVLQEFRQSALWPGADVGDDLGGRQGAQASHRR